jgi:hypothetical protein
MEWCRGKTVNIDIQKGKGEREIITEDRYNIWSIVHYLNTRKAKPYWE